MAEWVKWMKGFAKKPEVLRVAASLGVSRYHAASLIMEKVFEWTDENISAENLDKDGNATVTLGPLPLQLFDAQTEVPGLANAMSAAGWIIARSDSLVFPNFARHNGNSAKTRALTGSRVSKHRGKGRNADVTQAALPEEKRREEIEEERVRAACGEQPIVLALTDRIPHSLVEDLYRHYPRRIGPDAAFPEIEAAIRRVQQAGGFDVRGAHMALLSRVKAYARSDVVVKGEARFIPQPAKWFREGRFNDDDAAWQMTAEGRTNGKPSERDNATARRAQQSADEYA